MIVFPYFLFLPKKKRSLKCVKKLCRLHMVCYVMVSFHLIQIKLNVVKEEMQNKKENQIRFKRTNYK